MIFESFFLITGFFFNLNDLQRNVSNFQIICCIKWVQGDRVPERSQKIHKWDADIGKRTYCPATCILLLFKITMHRSYNVIPLIFSQLNTNLFCFDICLTFMFLNLANLHNMFVLLLAICPKRSAQCQVHCLNRVTIIKILMIFSIS